MSIERMTDRTLPLAERVLRLANEGRTLAGAEYAAALDALLADVAAADRLARADAGYWDWVGGDSCEWGVSEEHTAALAAYHARLAQGVGRGA